VMTKLGTKEILIKDRMNEKRRELIQTSLFTQLKWQPVPPQGKHSALHEKQGNSTSMKACVSIAMDMGILARNAQRRTRPMTNNTSHKKRSNSALKRDDASLVESGGTPIGGAQTRTQKTKPKPRGVQLWAKKGRPI